MLAAFEGTFERELQGKLPDMMQSSLAGLLGRSELKGAHQKLRREVGRMHEAPTRRRALTCDSRSRSSWRRSDD